MARCTCDNSHRFPRCDRSCNFSQLELNLDIELNKHEISEVVGGREHLDHIPDTGYGIGKWSDDDDIHPTITPFFGPR